MDLFAKYFKRLFDDILSAVLFLLFKLKVCYVSAVPGGLGIMDFRLALMMSNLERALASRRKIQLMKGIGDAIHI